MHNEWRGTFQEFEEAVEFGELDLFLRIDHARLQKEGGPAPAVEMLRPPAQESKPESDSEAATASESSAKTGPPPKQTFASAALPQPPPFAPAGSGKRAEQSIDEFLAGLGLSDGASGDAVLSEADVEALLAEEKAGEALSRARGQLPAASDGAAASHGTQRSASNTTVFGERIPSRTYFPSADAGAKPLRLARMDGSGAPPSPTAPRIAVDGSALTPSPSVGGFASARLPSSSSIMSLGGASSPSALPRYSASQRSGKAMAAEAAALASGRGVSAKALREAVGEGKDLQSALEHVKQRSASSTSDGTYHERGTVGAEDADELLASLGLGELDLTEEEAEAFLRDGTIPDGLQTGGSRLPTRGLRSKADKAREEVAAREIAQRARDKGYGSGSQGGLTPKMDKGDDSPFHTPQSQASSRFTDAPQEQEEGSPPEKSVDLAEAPATVEAQDPVGDSSLLVHEDQPPTPLESLTPSASVHDVASKAPEVPSKGASAGTPAARALESAAQSALSTPKAARSEPSVPPLHEPQASAQPSASAALQEVINEQPTSAPLAETAPDSAAATAPIVFASTENNTVAPVTTRAPAPTATSGNATASPTAVASAPASKAGAEQTTTLPMSPEKEAKPVAQDSLAPLSSTSLLSAAEIAPPKVPAKEAPLQSTADASSVALTDAGQGTFPPAKPSTVATKVASPVKTEPTVPLAAAPPAPTPAPVTPLTEPKSRQVPASASSAMSFEDMMSGPPPKVDFGPSSSSVARVTSLASPVSVTSSVRSPLPESRTSSQSNAPTPATPVSPTTSIRSTGTTVRIVRSNIEQSQFDSPKSPVKPMPPAPAPASASQAATPAVKPPEKKPSHTRTLSDILREADAAMQDDDDDLGIGDALLDYL